jgi:transcriptional regulator with PAS, ATPase and Fis domain
MPPVQTQFSRRSPDHAAPEIIVANDQMRDLLRFAQRAAESDAKVLITGESGTGKDVLARYIHFESARRKNEFVAVNCAGVTESLLESELFGHMKGSFTGAYRDKVGKLQLADRGTLFLDEVGEMSLRMQAVLLRFLENGEIQAVGADDRRTTVDVRVIAATNRNLPEMVTAGSFREDLLYRLRVIHLHVPPLRERREDIRPLADAFVKTLERSVIFDDEVWKALDRYRWPGNVRELQNVIEQMVCMAQPGIPLTVKDVPHHVSMSAPALLPPRERRRQVADDLYRAVVNGDYTFWDHIYPMFLNRDITRHDIRELVRRGLSVTRGSYRGLVELLKISPDDYKRFMNFLSTHGCRADFREFRNHPLAEMRNAPRVVLTPLPNLREGGGPAAPAEAPNKKAAS